MEHDFTIVENHSKNGDVTTEFKECDGKILIKQFSGTNTDNFIIKKYNGKRLQFSFFKINGIYYVNINGCHIIDYKHFINIQHISNVEDNVKIKNPYIGEIVLFNCDVDIIQRSLTVMAEWIRTKQSIMNELAYYIFH